MAKRKQFDLGTPTRVDQPGGEIERLFDAELRSAQKPVLRDLPISRVQPNPFQARQNFDDLDELVQSIHAHGFVSRLRVRSHPEAADQFQLVFGERRLRAARAAGMQTIPCEIAEHSDAQLMEIGLAENIQRQDLDPLEEAYAFQTLISQRGYTQQSLAGRIGKDVSYVTGRLHILKNTPLDVQHMVRQRTDTVRAAREIAKLTDAETRAPLIAGVLDRSLSIREVRESVREALARPTGNQSGASVPRSPAPAEHEAARDAQSPTPHERDALRVGDLEPGSHERAASGSEGRLTRGSAVLHGLNFDRDMRNVRAIFARWELQLDTLDERYVSQLVQFMTQEHLPQVDRLIKALERNHS